MAIYCTTLPIKELRTHRLRLSKPRKQLFITVGEHHATHGAQDVPGGHPAQDHRARAQGEIHREGVHHQPHLLDTGGTPDIESAYIAIILSSIRRVHSI